MLGETKLWKLGEVQGILPKKTHVEISRTMQDCRDLLVPSTMRAQMSATRNYPDIQTWKNTFFFTNKVGAKETVPVKNA